MEDIEDTLETSALLPFLSSSQLQFLLSLSLSFHRLLPLFTLLLFLLLVPLRQLLADPPVPEHPAADSYLRDFLFTTSHWGVVQTC